MEKIIWEVHDWIRGRGNEKDKETRVETER